MLIPGANIMGITYEVGLALFALMLFLHRRTFDTTIRTEHTAFTHRGFKNRATALAFIKPLTGVGRHGFEFLVTALWTGQR